MFKQKQKQYTNSENERHFAGLIRKNMRELKEAEEMLEYFGDRLGEHSKGLLIYTINSSKQYLAHMDFRYSNHKEDIHRFYPWIDDKLHIHSSYIEYILGERIQLEGDE